MVAQCVGATCGDLSPLADQRRNDVAFCHIHPRFWRKCRAASEPRELHLLASLRMPEIGIEIPVAEFYVDIDVQNETAAGS